MTASVLDGANFPIQWREIQRSSQNSPVEVIISLKAEFKGLNVGQAHWLKDFKREAARRKCVVAEPVRQIDPEINSEEITSTEAPAAS
jgi:hypothetical protein